MPYEVRAAMQSGASRVSVAFPPEQPGSVSVSATVPRRGWVPWPLIAARPRLLLYVAEPDTDPGCSCAAEGWDAAASFTAAGAPWSSPRTRQRSVALRSSVARTDVPRLRAAFQRASSKPLPSHPHALGSARVPVRLGDIKEEARAPRSPGARFSSAPGDSRRDGQPRSGPARKPLRPPADFCIRRK